MKTTTILIVLVLGIVSLASAGHASTVATTTTISSSPNPSIYGQPVAFTAAVTSSAGAPPDGETVTFLQGKMVLGTAPLSGGSATFTTSTLGTGNDLIKASYAGDANFGASTSTAITQVINQASTTTTLASSQNPSSYWQPVTFTASVATQFGGTATGNVFFYNGSVKLGGASLAGGVATLTATKLALGTNPITAVYSGSSSYASSTSSVVNQAVNPASTTTTLVSSLNPSTVGQSVTFIATVTAQFGGSLSGTVNFYNGGTLLKTGSLSGGTVKLITSSLPSGADLITATYSGNADFNTSSASLTQTVNPKPTGTFIDSTMTWPPVNGITRYYEVYLPANLPANPPMVLMLHGTQNTQTFDPQAVISLNWGWQSVADKYGFILVKPASTYDTSSHQWNWNAYDLDDAFPQSGGYSAPPDDSGFLGQMITNLIAQYSVNPNMVYVAGFSSGAEMSERVGVDLSNLVAAVAPASGQLVAVPGKVSPPLPLPGNVAAPVSVQEWHGTLDHELPPCSYGTTNYSGVIFTLDTVDDTFNYWSTQNSCSAFQTTATLCANGAPNNGNDAPSPGLNGYTGNIASSCANNVEVQFIWEPNVGHSSQQQNDTARWQFFAAHPKQTPR